MEVRILGPLEVVEDGVAVGVGGARERAILARLALSPNRVVAADRLVDDLWDGEPPERAMASLQVGVSQLRKFLDAARPGARDMIVTRAPGYLLAVDPDQLDVLGFQALVGEARELLNAGDAQRAGELLRMALAQWRGPPLADMADRAFLQAERTRFEEVYLAATEDRIDTDLALGKHGPLVAELRELTTAHPLRERFWAQRMLALYRSGCQADALRAYQELREVLGEELGIEPGPALRRLEEAILRQSPDLDAPMVAREAMGSGPLATAVGTALPEGTVTMLFSDIEGSTRLLSALGQRYGPMLSEHRRLLRTAFEARQGVEVGTEGDSFFVAFAHAADALAAALDAQRALAAGQFDDGASLRVRMGIHTGAVEILDRSYVGMAVHVAARIQAAAHGGQVLVSDTTAQIVGRDLAAPAALVDVGMHRLKDLDDPVHLFQLTHPDLRATFPPVRSLGQSHLPVPLTSFVGRDEERAVLHDMSGTTRLLTLTGPGGAGKTRLALAFASEVATSCRDGAYFVELAPVIEPAMVAAAVAGTFGVREESGRSLVETLIEYLRDRQLIVVIDNCEHLLAPVADFVHAVLVRCPDVRVVTTSREALSVTGELVYTVPPLPIPPDDLPRSVEVADYASVQLFFERARHVNPKLEITADNSLVVASICRRLDGIPLALELAAARTSVLALGDIEARLDDRFRLLASPNRGVRPSQQTLRAAIDWSHDLLSDGEQALFRRLSVFVGGFDLTAAETVAAAGDWAEVFDGVVALATKSLLQVDERADLTRYRMLDTIRAYAAEKLEAAGEVDEFRRRHAAWMLDLAVAAEPALAGAAEQLEWLDRLDVEHANLRAAMEWLLINSSAMALRLGGLLLGFFDVRGHVTEGRTFLGTALAAATTADAELRARALNAMGRLAFQQGDLAGARAIQGREQATLIESGNTRGSAMASCLANIGATAWSMGDHEAARRAYEESLALRRSLGNERGAARMVVSLAMVAHADGRLADAAALFADARVEAERLGDRQLLASAWAGFGLIAELEGADETACGAFEESLAISRDLGNRHEVAAALYHLGDIALRQGHDGDAAGLLREALSISWELHSLRDVAEDLEGFARLAALRHDWLESARLLGAGEHLRTTIGFPRPTHEVPAYERLVTMLRDKLGPEDLDAVIGTSAHAPLADVVTDLVIEAATPGTVVR